MSPARLAPLLIVLACNRGSGDPANAPTGAHETAPLIDAGGTPDPGTKAPPADGPGIDVRPVPDGPRSPMVAADHSFYDRIEGTAYPNDCKQDGDCFKSGCGGEICSAERQGLSTCEVLPLQWPDQSSCGCVEGTCQWWNPAGKPLLDPTPAPKRPAEAGPKSRPGATCGNVRCKPGEECIEYYGIAGSQGPRFSECGIRCRRGQPNNGCPPGTRCVTIADGPGPVCRK